METSSTRSEALRKRQRELKQERFALKFRLEEVETEIQRCEYGIIALSGLADATTEVTEEVTPEPGGEEKQKGQKRPCRLE